LRLIGGFSFRLIGFLDGFALFDTNFDTRLLQGAKIRLILR
jgi:hypothetical protein